MSRKLEIGPAKWPLGNHTEWEVFDLHEWDECKEYKQHIGDAKDLSRFADGTFTEVYASQVLEHFSHLETRSVISEWWRVVAPCGSLKVEVPNFWGIFSNFKKSSWQIEDWERFVERLYGAQDYEGNTHYSMFSHQHFNKQLQHWLPDAKLEVYEVYANQGGLRALLRKEVI